MKKVALIFIIIFGLGFAYAKANAGFFDFFYKNKESLYVAGNKVIANGKEIILRGVAVGDPHSRQTIDKRTVKDYEVIKKDWQANFVRLSVHPGVWRKDEEKGKKILEEEVKAARKQGLYVIIDWHVIGRPNGWYKSTPWGDDHYYSYSSNFNIAKDFWKYVALEYRSDKGVLFELWNEPADPDGLAWSDIKDYMQRLNDIIRSQGAENIVVAPGVWWTYDLRGIKDDPLKGDNIGYAWHNYPENQNKYIRWEKAVDNLYNNYPIFVTEWGFSDDPKSNYFCSLAGFPEEFKKYMLNRGMHFTAWCWHGSWKPAMLKSDWTDLTTFGKFVKNFLREINSGEGIDNLNNGSNIPESIQKQIDDFVAHGVDDNTTKLGEGERRAVVYSYEKAFGRLPENEGEMEDLIKIANGRWPSARSQTAEERAKNNFKFIYKRDANINNSNDNSAIIIMAYGLKQKAKNRNLNSERVGISIYKSIYGHAPSSTEDWNIMQAITYSGARR